MPVLPPLPRSARGRVASAAVAAVLLVGVAAVGDLAAEDAPALFADIARVLSSPRCSNCHSADQRPRQGENSRQHDFNVRGGVDGRGQGIRCTTCHQPENIASTGVPGAPGWRLAPAAIGWGGLPAAAICARLKDGVRAANLPIDALVGHMRTDPLVRWAWEPGGQRTPPPLAFDEFVGLVAQWIERGAACPS